ncbi:hypothetical protein Gohar_020522, partial [Gossypium harknessii]|nr:hypothetical protein [Gossypium harknessii]
MMCFLLPKSLCEELESIMARFWWQKEHGRRGIHWCEWSRLCKFKEMGGLGFRSLAKFNLALLAKQGCRLINNPNSLLTQVFKAKYYLQCDFLEARLRNLPSYTWQSIWAARGLLEKGICWRVGKGDKFSIEIRNGSPGCLEEDRVTNVVSSTACFGLSRPKGTKISMREIYVLGDRNLTKRCIVSERRPPENQTIYINFDAAYNPQQFRSASELIAKNDSGKVLVSKSLLEKKVASVFTAEACVCSQAVRLGISNGVDSVKIKDDALTSLIERFRELRITEEGASVTGLDLSSRNPCGLRRSVHLNSPKSAFTQVKIPLELLQGTNLYSGSDLCQKKQQKNNRKSTHNMF